MGSSWSRSSSSVVVVEGEREKEDVFKALFRSMTATGSITADTAIPKEEFVAAIQGNQEALSMLATLGDAGSNLRHKAIEKGDDAALKALFDAMDTNTDGRLTWAEWSRYVGARRNVNANKLFAKLDTAQTGKIEAKQFISAVQEDKQILALFDLNGCSSRNLLATLDANGDGVISKDELTSAVQDVQAMTPRKKPVKKIWEGDI